MRSLLDVNVLIALLDGNHILNSIAHERFNNFRHDGWASCPITEIGVIRIMTDPNYKRVKRITAHDVAEALGEMTKINHEFWPDDISILDRELFATESVHSSKQVTDNYLLALAVRRNGRFVTFDRKVSLSAVPPATSQHLLVIEDS